MTVTLITAMSLGLACAPKGDTMMATDTAGEPTDSAAGSTAGEQEPLVEQITMCADVACAGLDDTNSSEYFECARDLIVTNTPGLLHIQGCCPCPGVLDAYILIPGDGTIVNVEHYEGPDYTSTTARSQPIDPVYWSETLPQFCEDLPCRSCSLYSAVAKMPTTLIDEISCPP